MWTSNLEPVLGGQSRHAAGERANILRLKENLSERRIGKKRGGRKEGRREALHWEGERQAGRKEGERGLGVTDRLAE